MWWSWFINRGYIMSITAVSISETFEALAVGDINGLGSYTGASAWDTTGTGASSWCKVYTGKSLQLKDGGSSEKAHCHITLDSDYRSKQGYIQFKYMHPAIGHTSYVSLEDASNTTICAIGLNYTGQIRGHAGSTWFDLQGFGGNTWYTVKIVFDVIAKTASFYVDSVLKATKTLVGSTNPIMDIVFETVTSDSTYYAYMDNLVFKGYASGSSSVTVSSSIVCSRSREFSGSSVVTIATSVGKAGAGASAAPDYQYYLGSYNGKVFAENKDYKSDAGQKINSYWLSKQTDFADEDITCLGKFKTVYGMQLWYKDIETDVPVTVGISTNGGVTWETQTKTFGTADDKEKTALYYFIVTGNIFQFKIQNDSDTKTFQWTALKALYTIGGDFFEIN